MRDPEGSSTTRKPPEVTATQTPAFDAVLTQSHDPLWEAGASGPRPSCPPPRRRPVLDPSHSVRAAVPVHTGAGSSSPDAAHVGSAGHTLRAPAPSGT